VTRIQLRVAAILKTWLTLYATDFTEPLLQTVEKLTNAFEKSHSKAVADSIRNAIGKARIANERIAQPDLRAHDPLTLIGSFREPISPPERTLFSYSDEEIARQICLVDSQVFSAINASEFFHCAWSNKETAHRSPNLRKMTARFNRLGYWVSMHIVLQDRLRLRTVAVARFVQIAKCLRSMGNYNSVMGILAGLGTSAIHRLKHTWEALDQSVRQDFEELRDLMKTERSYGDYRQELQQAPPPKIPYMGVYMSDLVFLEDGNEDVLDDQINFHKRSLMWKTLQEIILFQSTPYRYPLPERDLYALSLLCEPRGCVEPPLL